IGAEDWSTTQRHRNPSQLPSRNWNGNGPRPLHRLAARAIRNAMAVPVARGHDAGHMERHHPLQQRVEHGHIAADGRCQMGRHLEMLESHALAFRVFLAGAPFSPGTARPNCSSKNATASSRTASTWASYSAMAAAASTSGKCSEVAM